MLRRVVLQTLLLGMLFVSAPLFAAEATVVLNVEGMTCNVCPITVKKALETVDGVSSAEVSLEAAEATVVYDDSKTNPQALADAVTEAGYPAMVK